MSKMSQSILDKIKQEHRRPLPSWRFVLKNAAVWFLVILAISIAAVFTGTQLAQFIQAEWGIASRWPGGEFGFVREMVSWLWIGGIVLSFIGAFVFLRFTKRGYRYSFAWISLILFTVFVAGGSLFLPTPIPAELMNWQDKKLPRKIDVARFHNPQEGRLMGEILSEVDNTIFLEAVDHQVWELWVFQDSAVLPQDLVQVFGEVIDPSTFAVLSIQTIPPHYFVQGFPKELRISQ